MKYVYSKLGVNVDLCCGGWQQSSSLSSIIGLGHRGKELFVLSTISYNDVHDSPNAWKRQDMFRFTTYVPMSPGNRAAKFHVFYQIFQLLFANVMH